jgi:hypothetical protein
MKRLSSSAFALATSITSLFAALPASATLTPSLSRGEQTIQLPIQGRSNTEICVIPTHLAGGDYSSKDLEQERMLCSLIRGQNAAVCPKTKSTNPGAEFYLVPSGSTTASVEAKNCFVADPKNKAENALKKVAKYKQSVSCSYTPSLLAYYHVSRLLGGAGRVPPVVLRTFDLAQHKEIAAKGMAVNAKMHGTGELIYKTWASLAAMLKAGAASQKKDELFTDAIDQTYGALQLNPTGEAKYSEMFTPSKAGETRAAAFGARNAIFQDLRKSADVSQIVGRGFTAANVQKMQQLKDAADMVLLDTLFSQQDRFGNTHSLVRYAYLDGNDMDYAGKLTPELQSKGAVAVKVMMLKDNDCGITKTNAARDARLLDKVAHMDPKTYRGLLQLNSTADSAEITKAFKQGMMLTTMDWIGNAKRPGVRTLIAEAAKSLQARCRAGTLKLDLDLGAHFSGQQIKQNCEL